MKVDKSFFSIAPKTFKAIDVHPPTIKSFVVVDLEMSISTENKAIAASKSISINNRTTPYDLDNQIKDNSALSQKKNDSDTSDYYSLIQAHK